MHFDVSVLLPWTREQLAKGCTYEQLVWSLAMEQGYAWHVAHRIVEACVQYGGNEGELFSQAPVEARPLPRPLFTRPGQYELEGRPLTLALVNAYPQIAFFEGLASSEECAQMIEHSRSRRTASTVSGNVVAEQMPSVRSSSTAHWREGEHEATDAVRRRLARLLQWPLGCCERLQVQHYDVGLQYRPHHDYFDPQVHENTQLMKDYGNRVATAIVYLNQPRRGGSTYFSSLGLEVFPRTGSVLFFSYPELDATSMSLHAGSPVEEGEKWIATLWLRQRSPQRPGVQAAEPAHAQDRAS